MGLWIKYNVASNTKMSIVVFKQIINPYLILFNIYDYLVSARQEWPVKEPDWQSRFKRFCADLIVLRDRNGELTYDSNFSNGKSKRFQSLRDELIAIQKTHPVILAKALQEFQGFIGNIATQEVFKPSNNASPQKPFAYEIAKHAEWIDVRQKQPKEKINDQSQHLNEHKKEHHHEEAAALSLNKNKGTAALTANRSSSSGGSLQFFPTNAHARGSISSSSSDSAAPVSEMTSFQLASSDENQ